MKVKPLIQLLDRGFACCSYCGKVILFTLIRRICSVI